MIASMTAYARQERTSEAGTLNWELRGVNSRYLECQIRMPDSLMYLETQIRTLLKKAALRGKVECTLRYQPLASVEAALQINTQLLDTLVTVSQGIAAQLPPSVVFNPMEFLAWPGVTRMTDNSLTAERFAPDAIIELFELALQDFMAVRRREGLALEEIIKQRLTLLAAEVATVQDYLPALRDKQREKLRLRLAELRSELDNNRLEQEMLLFVQKTDVAEELDRLSTHMIAVKRLLEQSGPQGKHLDFLMQELHREANTLGAKAGDQHITSAAVAMKVLIEQMREQVQNIE